MNARHWLLIAALFLGACQSSDETGTDKSSEEAKVDQTKAGKSADGDGLAAPKDPIDDPESNLAPPISETSPLMTDEIASYTCGQIRNVHTYQGLVFGGQPSPEDFQLVKAAGVRTVFNLRPASEIQDFDEQQVVTELGLEYVSLPFAGPDQLTDEVFDRSREILATVKRPALFHCGSANRVGALWLPYRVLNDGLSLEDALAEAKTIGLRSPGYEEKALDYIERKKND